MVTPAQEFLLEVESFLQRTGMPASTFGWEALKDRNFFGDLKESGREPRFSTMAKVRAFIAEHSEKETAS